MHSSYSIGAIRPAHGPARRIAAWSSRTRRSARLIEEGRIEIDPYDPALLQPSSVDVRVDRYFRVFRNSLYPYIDVQGRAGGPDRARRDRRRAVHPPSGRVRARLDARAGAAAGRPRRTPRGEVELLGRLGLLIHSTAGFIDPGWDGHVTLELSNVANLPITIYHGMKIGQLSFVQLTEPAERPYGSDGARLEVPGPARADAEPVLEELRASDPRHRRNGFRRAEGRPRAARARTATCARSSASPSRATTLADLGLRARRGRRHRRGEPARAAARAATRSSTSSRSSRASPTTSSA